MIKLTLNFCDNWQYRVGNWPTAEMVQAILDQSVTIHPSMQLYQKDGSEYRVFAIYWHPELDLVIKTDETEANDKRALYVYSKDNYIERNHLGRGRHRAKQPRRARRSKGSQLLSRRAQRGRMSVRETKKTRQCVVF